MYNDRGICLRLLEAKTIFCSGYERSWLSLPKIIMWRGYQSYADKIFVRIYGFQIDSTVFSSCNIWQSFDRLDYHVSAGWFNIIISPYQYRNSTMLLGMQGLKLIPTSKRTPGSNSEVYGLKTTPVSHHNIAQQITNHVHNFWLVLLHFTQQKT